MKNSMKIALLSLLLPLHAKAFEEVVIDVAVDSQHEECFYLDTETTISYHYKTTNPLDFNLHYHDDNGMNYLIELPKSLSNKKTVKDLTNKQVYCLMWINSTKNKAELSYEFTLEK